MRSRLYEVRRSECGLCDGDAAASEKVGASRISGGAIARGLACTLLILAALCGSAEANPVTYGFGSITENSQIDSAIGASQITVDASNGGNTVTFTFRNEGPEACAIAEVYFDDGTLLELTRYRQ